MRNLIANTLSAVLVWVVVGPAALVAASGPQAHECCYRSHHSAPASQNHFENQAPSHECCRLLFTSQAPTVTARSLSLDWHPALESSAVICGAHYAGIKLPSHPERAPPFSGSSLNS